MIIISSQREANKAIAVAITVFDRKNVVHYHEENNCLKKRRRKVSKTSGSSGIVLLIKLLSHSMLVFLLYLTASLLLGLL